MAKERLEEFALIDLLTGKCNTIPTSLQPRISIGNGDDAAVVKGANGYDWVVCCDTMVEDVHFKGHTMNPYDIGYKALASNISDVAAMGGAPLFYLVSIAIPASLEEKALAKIYEGMATLAKEHSMALIGGDTVSSPSSMMVTVTVLGEVEAGRKLTRRNAKEGDLIFLTGTVGDSGAGLDLLLEAGNGVKDHNQLSPSLLPLVERHCRPNPDVQAGRILAKSGLRVALNDISDGLASESWEIAKASDVQFHLNEACIPLSSAVKEYGDMKEKDPFYWAYYGGEDYKLVGCVPEIEKERIEGLFQQANHPLFWIGKVEKGEPGVFLEKGNDTRVPLPKKGYNHFTGKEVGED